MGRTFVLLTLALAATAATAATGATTATPAAAAPRPVPPAIAAARLQGQFLLEGRVTKAKHIPGERVGQVVSRTWTFNPTCPSGTCDRIQLVRARASGTDTLVLRRRRPGYYVGAGTFFAPLRCGPRVYPQGAAVPFTVTVTVTASLDAPTGLVASRVNATYENRSRRNRTPCVGILGHDAATYHVHLLLGPPPPGSGGV
jgi:hypothetical protein